LLRSVNLISLLCLSVFASDNTSGLHVVRFYTSPSLYISGSCIFLNQM